MLATGAVEGALGHGADGCPAAPLSSPRRAGYTGGMSRAHDVRDGEELAFEPEPESRLAGVGVDIVDIDRFEAMLARTPRLKERLFAPEERGLSLASLAARAAAKEATGKALGNPGELSWQDVIVRKTAKDRPYLVLRGNALTTAVREGVSALHLSLSHDGRLAVASVAAERRKSLDD